MRLSFWMYLLLLPVSWLWHSDPAGAFVYVCLFKENQDRDELRWQGRMCDQRERWRPADDESKEAKQFARCISGSCLNIPINRLELMGHTVCGCECFTTTDTWMNQWQRFHQNKPVCSWMWRSECLKQEETPETNGGQKKRKWCRSTDCYCICFFCVVWSNSGFAPPPPPPSRPYGKGPTSLWCWHHPPHYTNCCPTEGLVSMPPNKSLVTVSWQDETFQPLRKPTIH